MLTLNDIQRIQQGIEDNTAGFRSVPGTALKNSLGEVIYTPPQHPDKIVKLMGNLEQFINSPQMADWCQI